MKTTKVIIIAALAASIISIGAIVACNKEVNTVVEENAPTTKTFTKGEELLNSLYTIWHLSDSIIQNRPADVAAHCQAEDISSFLSLANISSNLYGQTLELLEQKIGNVTFPDSLISSACSDCHAHVLSTYVERCIQLRRHLDEIHLYEPNFNDSTVIKFVPGVTECEYNCKMEYIYIHHLEPNYFLCLLNCEMKVYIDEAEYYLDYYENQLESDE